MFRGKIWRRLLEMLLFAMIFIITVYPFAMMITGSFKQDFEIVANSYKLWPEKGWDTMGYSALFKNWPFTRNLLNSLFVSSASTLLTCFFCTLAGYTFAKYEFKGKTVLFFVALSSLMLPFETRMIATYQVVKMLKGLNSFWALIIPNCIPVFGIFMIRQFAAKGVPMETIECARMEGATEWQIFMKVGFPMLKPAVMSLAILTFMNSWNDFLWPIIMTTKAEMLTVTALMRSVSDTTLNGSYSVMLAGATLSSLPILLIYILCSRQIIGGIMEGSVKE